ncbi:CBO0543 family protein [Ammoniphilus sp. YIM 78166]|uniref:CBO0543 family protein n=1 Tax=Ammoniphilus sp. YIM 78166 TaxID=1644106 RepID=UPI00106F4BC3|nr:CBO0543 family protein [Ammoniphilus sp. YIM 78166]
MFFNFVIGFIIPWILGVWIYKRNSIIVILIAPIGVVAATVINEWGFNYLWKFKPFLNNQSLSALPLDLGIYPVLACYFIYLVNRGIGNKYTLLLLFAIFITLLEWIAVKSDRVIYLNGWNIGWTFCVYLLTFMVIYRYYKLLQNKNYLKRQDSSRVVKLSI